MNPPRIAYLPGDGIGPEVLASARAVAEAAGFVAEWCPGAVGWAEWGRHGDALPAATRTLLDETDACLFGAITSQGPAAAEAALPAALQATNRQYRSPILRIRQEKALHLNVRPNTFLPGVPGPLADPPTGATITILRENSEGLYAGAEAHPVPPPLALELARHMPAFRAFAAHEPAELAISTRVVTRRATRRLLDAACREARRQGHRSITVAEKANVLRATGGLVLEVVAAVQADHPDLALHVAHIDALAADLVHHPERHPIIVATNLFGDILSDLAAALTGGLGLAASASLGDHYALFEPVHGSAPDIAGRGIANPIAAIRSAAILATWCGDTAAAGRIDAAVLALLADPAAPRTPDLGGDATTAEVTAAIIDGLATVTTPKAA